MKNSGKSSKTTAKKAGRPAGTGFITELDRYLFGQGTHYKIFEKLGAIPAPMAESRVCTLPSGRPCEVCGVVGDFNGWDPEASPMKPLEDSGIYEAFIPALELASFINLPSPQRMTRSFLKRIPMRSAPSSGQEPPPSPPISPAFPGAMRNGWRSGSTQSRKKAPMAIYEVHLGSWRKASRPEKDGYYTYKELPTSWPTMW